MTGVDRGSQLPGDLMAELRRIQSVASGLGNLLSTAQDAAPAEAAGSDSTGAVQVVLGPDGFPARIRVGSDWRHRVEPDAFGAAVGEAFGAASADRMEAWMTALREAGWEADVERLRAGDDDPSSFASADPVPAAFRVPPAAENPRALHLVTEDLLTAFRVLDEHTSQPPAAPAGTGSAASGRLTITLSPAGGLSCAADPRWVSRVDRTTLTNALNEALAAARDALAEANQPASDPTSGLDQLFGEALGILNDPGRAAGSL